MLCDRIENASTRSTLIICINETANETALRLNTSRTSIEKNKRSKLLLLANENAVTQQFNGRESEQLR